MTERAKTALVTGATALNRLGVEMAILAGPDGGAVNGAALPIDPAWTAM